MLFAHGFGCDQNMWRFVAPAFEDDYRVVLFDYVGAGRSDLVGVRRRSATRRSTATRRTCSTSATRSTCATSIFVGHSVSAMVGVLAANREPERFARLILVGPSPRYINEPPDYVGGFERADIEGLLETMDKNYIGWANFLAPAIMKNPDRPELGAELDGELLLDRSGDRAAVRRGDVLRRQPRRPARAVRVPSLDPAVLRRHHRAARGRRVPAPRSCRGARSA